jgi:hypothetical protein
MSRPITKILIRANAGGNDAVSVINDLRSYNFETMVTIEEMLENIEIFTKLTRYSM